LDQPRTLSLFRCRQCQAVLGHCWDHQLVIGSVLFEWNVKLGCWCGTVNYWRPVVGKSPSLLDIRKPSCSNTTDNLTV